MVRKTFDLSGGSVFYGLQDKTVQSIMGATENLLTTESPLEASFSGVFAGICCTLVYCGLPRF